MNATRKAIEDSIKGGFEPIGKHLMKNSDGTDGFTAEVLIDPDFWKALGRTREWYQCPLRHHPHTNKCAEGSWIHMRRLIDHLYNGKDIESFFKDL